MELPFSPACERNKIPILEVLKGYILLGDVLEVGHGTGQHAEYFASSLPVVWHPSDLEDNHWMLRERSKHWPLEWQDKIAAPLSLRVQSSMSLWEQLKRDFDHVYTANTLHIMTEQEAYLFCEQVDRLVKAQGFLFLYGPFLYQGQATSESNIQFDAELRSRGTGSGLREFDQLAKRLTMAFDFIARHDLPANNQLLVFQRHRR